LFEIKNKISEERRSKMAGSLILDIALIAIAAFQNFVVIEGW
jgi:hypothetical protein